MKPKELILVLEDDELEMLTLRRAFADASVINPVLAFTNAKDALVFLLEAHNELPGLILLDLNLPGMSGLEFLQTIKNHDRLKRIPVVILTTSNEERDRSQAYDLSAAGYVVKPMSYQAFVRMIEIVAAYWQLNESPK